MSVLNLVDNGKVNIAFIKANKHLLDQKNISSFEELQQYWLEEFNCKLLNNQLIFENDRKLSLFIMQWS